MCLPLVSLVATTTCLLQNILVGTTTAIIIIVVITVVMICDLATQCMLKLLGFLASES